MKWRKICWIYFREYMETYDRYIYHKTLIFFQDFLLLQDFQNQINNIKCNLNVYFFIIILLYSYQIERLFSFFKDHKFEREISSSRSACRKIYSLFLILRVFDHCLSYSLRFILYYTTQTSHAVHLVIFFSFFKATLVTII